MRFDLLSGEWVKHRRSSPDAPEPSRGGLPFLGGREAPHPYEARWFTNRWPAFESGPALDFDAVDASVPSVGACEVVLFSPAHGSSLASLGAEQVRKVVDVWAKRTEALLARPEVEYVLVFENRGREVGATIDHPHGQIYGYPFVPPAPAREARTPGGPCLICIDVASELKSGDRIVTQRGEWVAWVASGELGSGTLSNPVVPEDAARALKDA